jgi:hypothetical protein
MTALAICKLTLSNKTIRLIWHVRGLKLSWVPDPTCLNSFVCLSTFKAVILIVSAYDIYLTVKYLECLPQMEQNPICRWLLGFDQGPTTGLQQAAAFITAKFTGNVIVLGVLEALATLGFRLVGVVAASTALFQILLCAYLILAINPTD